MRARFFSFGIFQCAGTFPSHSVPESLYSGYFGKLIPSLLPWYSPLPLSGRGQPVRCQTQKTRQSVHQGEAWRVCPPPFWSGVAWPSTPTLDGYRTSCRQLLDHLLDPVGTGLEVGVDLLQRARRREPVEVPVEGDLEADDADAAVQRVALLLVDPGVGDVGLHLALEVVEHRLIQRHVLVVAQAGVGLGVAFLVEADVRLGVALGEGAEDRLLRRGADLQDCRLEGGLQCLGKGVAVGEHLLRVQGGAGGLDRLALGLLQL